jgi:3-hydroxyacyl-[acyl-carrier-protein] dehydratase
MRLEYFQMIDRVVALNPAERVIRSVATIPKESTIFEGHFPSYPLMPGVLLTEAMAQTTGWLVIAMSGFTAMPFLASVNGAKFRTLVFPGDALEFEGTVTHEGSGYSVGECKGRRDGKVVCDATLTFRVMPFPSPEFREMLTEWAKRIDVEIKEFAR